MFKKHKNIILLALILLLAVSLRFYKISDTPPGLYIDEVDIGVNAYDILSTGKDEWGQSFPLYFKSFGDYKPPGYIYLTSISMALWGKNEFSIRFFSALSGILTVLVFYFFLRTIVRLDKEKSSFAAWLPLLGAFLLAVSPWHIHFSRGGFEITVVVFLFLLAVYLALLYYEKKKIIFLLLCAICFAAASYTYQSFRVLAPLSATITFIILYYKSPKSRTKIIALYVFMLVLILPLILTFMSAQSTARYLSTSAFSEDKSLNIMDKIFTYPMIYLKNYLSFFSLNFLFSMGDGNGRHQVPGMGLFYRWELPFIIIGIYGLLKQKKKMLYWITLGLILLTPIIPSVAVPSPHSLRSLLMVFPFTILVSIGILYTIPLIKRYKIILITLFIFVSSMEFGLYLHSYYYQYPIVNALDWGAAYKQTVQEAINLHPNYKHIVVDSKLQNVKTYFDFYAPDMPILIVNDTWKKPEAWNKDTILYIRPFYETKPNKNIIKQIYLPGPDKNIFSQFWKI
jgi:4-amino-4-deoxy-L-arabinose transferase-like glycosyltransferase